MPTSTEKIISEMRAAVPAGLPYLDTESHDILREYTELLLESSCGHDEYHRYQGIRDRVLPPAVLQELAGDRYAGKRVLVVGGTGCIGSKVLEQLRSIGAAELFCLYALTDIADPVPGVVYLNVDIRDQVATRASIREISPDVIFHCAAQRSPWLAEREVARTLMTNVIGTRNVLRAARDIDLPLFVHASTGKAMRYYTTDVYAASKKFAEWLVHDYAVEGRSAGLARFTHVVDNAVVLDKIDESLASADGIMRVHDADTHFYAQSASESAQLLLLAGVQHAPGLRGVAIRELGEPVGLVDLVCGRISERRAAGSEPVIYFSGYDQGYESGQAPGLYDPHTASEVSPLINAVEAQTAGPLESMDEVDAFRVRLPTRGRESEHLADRIDATCRRGDRMDMLAEIARDAARQADAALKLCPEPLFSRLDGMARRARQPLPTSAALRASA